MPKICDEYINNCDEQINFTFFSLIKFKFKTFSLKIKFFYININKY